MEDRTFWLKIKPENGGVQLSWGDDPLDFAWQDVEQVRQLIGRLKDAIGAL